MTDVISVLMRWLHIASMATLIGGMIFGRFVMAEAAAEFAPDQRLSLQDRAAAHFKPLVFAAMGGLILSGLYNLFTNLGHTPLYHALLGVKLLLALHVFAIGILVARPGNPRAARMMAGAAISGLAIIALSAYLRHIY